MSMAGGYAASELLVVVALTDNMELDLELESPIVFPKKGTYFAKIDSLFVTGIASRSSTEPEISWDGNTGTVKPLDEKFIPPVSGLIVKSSTADSTKKFKITVDDTGSISATEVTE